METDDDDVFAALLTDPFLTVGEAEREAAALSGARLPVECHFAAEEDLGDE
jgi:hypothetical protein